MECDNPFACDSASECGPEGGCFCVPTTEGGSRCHEGQSCEVAACVSSADCPDGELCAQTCCEQLICVLPCGQFRPEMAAIQAVDGGRWSAPRR